MEELLKDIIADAKKTNKRMFVIIIVLLGVLFTTNAYWIWQNGQWAYSTEQSITDTSGNGIAVINGEGGVDIGTSECDQKDQNKSLQGK